MWYNYQGRVNNFRVYPERVDKVQLTGAGQVDDRPSSSPADESGFFWQSNPGRNIFK
jgi:hypothetical protein